tara:strand:- start:26569 stop:28185 length:1617 start_codon:yes stop_codon:yes gene_type:complete
MNYDLVIIGAGPAGLSAAIQYAKFCRENNQEPSVCILEKGSDVGAHILSGAVLEPKALNELIPDWADKNAPLQTSVTQDEFYFLTAKNAIKLPTPPTMDNTGNYIVSLGQFCNWLATQAEEIGVEIFAGFAASHILYNKQQRVVGVQTGDMGLDKNNQPKSSFQPGVNIYAKYTLFAEGCRGQLSQQLIKKFDLDKNAQPQTYGLGIKELWEVSPEHHEKGKVLHTVGWPLDNQTYGGSFLYHLDENLISIGLVIGLDYKNPYLSPYQEFQRFKHHPKIAEVLKGGRVIRYGARALNEGGWQSLPQLHFPGGLLLGCSAGFLNVAKIKGTHTAMKSGMLAATSVFEALKQKTVPDVLESYTQKINHSWIKTELHQVRNIRPSFKWGLWLGLAYSAIDHYILRGKAPWTLSNHLDHECTQVATKYTPINYPKPDGKISFDRLTSVSKSDVFHEEDQPCHLHIKDKHIPVQVNYEIYGQLESRYCPAGVYEYVTGNDQKIKLQINAQNCIHCKTCDIKDPKQNITWTAPEGTGGPNYSNM